MDVSAFTDSFRLNDGARRRAGTIGGKASEDYCATKWGNYLQGLAVQAMTCGAGTGRPGGRRLRAMGFVVSPVPNSEGPGAPGNRLGENEGLLSARRVEWP